MGLVGSFHCVGMCGPLALSLPVSNTAYPGKVFSILAYNFGRAVTYFTLGIVLGWTGSRLILVDYQQAFSIGLGLLILFFLIAGKYLPQINIFSGVQQKLKKTLSGFLQRKNNAFNLFIFGLLNGLLPCGLVYMAIASALIIGTPFQSGLFMMAFGLGTLPLMAMLMLTGHYISFSLRAKMKKLIPFFIAFVALLMILRGMNLGIPYISPAFNTTMANGANCAPVH